MLKLTIRQKNYYFNDLLSYLRKREINMKDFNITKKWLNRFCFLSIILFSFLVMCVLNTHITEVIKEATDQVAIGFIMKTKGGLEDGLFRIFSTI